MPYFALLYEATPDYVARRLALREDHLHLARASSARGELLFGGAFADPVDRALLVFQAADASVVEDFAKNDPYVVNGLVARWEVRPWTVVVGALFEGNSSELAAPKVAAAEDRVRQELGE
ncbi:MAG: YciI-like protein [Thermomicrobiales bacterium]